MNLASLVDEYLYEVARLYTPATEKKYGQILAKLIEDCGDKMPVEVITREDCLRCLNRWKEAKPATRALHTSIFKRFFEYALDHGYIPESPMRKVERPRLPRAEDREVVIVSTNDVRKMFRACRGWGDEICLGVLAYTGSRRNSVSMLKWRDLDLEPDPPYGPHGWIRLREKGEKVVDKPIPVLLRQIIDKAPEHNPEDYLVPNYRPGAVTRSERDNKIIWNRVKNIAARAEVEAHVHSIRAAFAVFFLENTRGSIKSLQTWLGHESLETTRHYTRGLNKKQLLSEGLKMDWGAGFVDSVMEEVESALTEGNQGTSETKGRGSGDGSAPPAGLTGASYTELLAPVALPFLPSVSALSEGGEQFSPGHDQSQWEQPASGSGLPSSESALGQREGQERLAAHHMLPSEPEKAHTGFEPVLPEATRLYQDMLRARHHFGHRTGHYVSV